MLYMARAMHASTAWRHLHFSSAAILAGQCPSLNCSRSSTVMTIFAEVKGSNQSQADPDFYKVIKVRLIQIFTR